MLAGGGDLHDGPIALDSSDEGADVVGVEDGALADRLLETAPARVPPGEGAASADLSRSSRNARGKGEGEGRGKEKALFYALGHPTIEN